MKQEDLEFEESLRDDWSRDLEVIEVPLANRTLNILGIVILFIGILVGGRVLMLSRGYAAFSDRAHINVTQQRELAAPRGIIYDRNGEVLAENEPSFLVFLDAQRFVQERQREKEILEIIENYIGLTPDEVWKYIRDADLSQRSGKVLLADDVEQGTAIKLKGLNMDMLSLEDGFKRVYPEGKAFSSIIGYTGLVNGDDLKKDPLLSLQAVIGRSGVEQFYDQELRGTSGAVVQLRDAKGNPLGEPEIHEPFIGTSLHLTIDGALQKYFYERLQERLRVLGSSVGLGIAMNPQNGEILALLNVPGFDNNLFVSSGKNEEKRELLASPLRPLFNRAVSGMYNPGSTIKPLLAIAALEEEVITPEKEIFSPGYLDVPNPYDPENPTRFLDWRYQGSVDLSAAIAQSSNVYFYVIGGGYENTKGLGIERLREWWGKFNLGKPTGIDLPSEAKGLLPSIDQKRETTGEPWRIGDTYNVSIGQGDLLLNPLQILNYISSIGNGGKLYRPFVNGDFNEPQLIKNFSHLSKNIREVQKGLRETVSSPLGTAFSLSDLAVSVGAKTGSAQVKNKTQENAFFVGYAPADNPEIVILVLVEDAKEGSANTLPIAKDVLNWYYTNRIRK